MTRYTSFVAVEKETTDEVAGKLRTESVATRAPEGWNSHPTAPASAAQPRPATSPRPVVSRQATSPRPSARPAPANPPRGSQPRQPRPSRPANGDGGFRFPRGSGAIEWVFIASLGLFAAGRGMSRRGRNRSAAKH